MDVSKLIKLLNLTESSNEHESLSALRMANLILRKNNTTWDEVIRPGTKKSAHKTLDVARTFEMPFGKYAGIPLGLIEERDYSYLIWLADKAKPRPPLCDYVKEIIESHT